jgi:hypothetical protein
MLFLLIAITSPAIAEVSEAEFLALKSLLQNLQERVLKLEGENAELSAHPGSVQQPANPKRLSPIH